jgi:hypothetical protein
LPGSIGILYAESVNLSNGGVLGIRVSGYQTPGTDFASLVTGNLILGGTSELTLDLTGLSSAGLVRGMVTDGGQTEVFGSVQVINNPLLFGDTLVYRNDGIDVFIL